MKSYTLSLPRYSRSQRTGLIFLLFVIVAVQIGYELIDLSPQSRSSPESRKWLALQSCVDSLKQHRLKKVPKRYPFNPNFISDYKGYKLGMTVQQIDRLHEFRKGGRYVNSAVEFQRVTGVSDSLLAVIRPSFKFPDWVIEREQRKSRLSSRDFSKKAIAVLDINAASQQELMKLYGIGPALSERILAQRQILGGFVSMDQMELIWGLNPEVVGKLREAFEVRKIPAVTKLRINEATARELSAFPYFGYRLAKAIITFRTMNGKISNSDDLTKIPDFPVDNIKIIALYLEF